MSRNNTIEVTVRGRVAADPVFCTSANGTEYARFRLAVTPRILDRTTGEWGDGHTEWISVRVFGQQFAKNVAKSLKKGQPAIVSGTLSSGEWKSDGQTYWGLNLRAEAVGHDLHWGRSEYFKAADEPTTASRPTEEPTDDGDQLAAEAAAPSEPGVEWGDLDATAA
jgi:single-strand DNA-binding protein